MGVNNFRAEDLNSANLESLLSELRAKVNNDDYASIQAFARDFASKIQGMTIGVTNQGKRVVEVNSTTIDSEGHSIPAIEYVDLNNAVTRILQVIEESGTHTLTGTQKAERDAMYVEVDKQLTALFKQDKMMEELAARGFKPEDYYAQAEKSNAMSDERIARYKKELDNLNKTRKNVLGEDFIDPDPTICEKSLATKLQDEKDGKAHLQNIEKSLARVRELEDAIKMMEDEIEADPTLEGRNRGNIEANLNEIAQLTTNIEGAVRDLTNLRFPGLDVDSIKKCHDKASMPRDDAEKAVRKLLYGAQDRTVEEYDKGMNLRIANAYGEIEKSIKKNDKDSYIPEMAEYKDPDETKREAARAAIDGYVKGLDKKIADTKRKKSQEEILKVARTKSVAEYQKVVDKNKELEAKFDKVNVQRKDEDGNLIFLEPDGTPTLEDTGRPLMGEQLVPKPSTRAEYLSDFDKAGKKAQIEEDGKQRLEEMSRREKRQILKDAGIGNWFTRFVMPGRLVERDMPLLLPAYTSVELAELDAQEQAHLDSKMSVDIGEYDRTKGQMNIVEAAYEVASKRAPVQQRMQDGAYDVAETRVEKPELVRAMQEASYEEVSLLLAGAFLKGDNLVAFEKARKEYDLKRIVDRNATQPGVEVRDNPKTPVHDDIVL